jgi:hypothetical protein
MKKALLAVMAIALVIGFAGCDIWPFGAKSPYLPLAEGNKWEYSGWTVMEITYPPETIEDYYDSTATSSTTEVMGETELTGDEAIKVWEVKSTTDDVSTTSYVDVDKDWVYYYDDLSDSEEWYKWPTEPVIADKWDIVVEVVDTLVDPPDTTTSTTTYEVVEEGVEAFGDYTDCIKIKVLADIINVDDYETYENYLYWAKKTGYVMSYIKAVMIRVVDEDTITTRIEGETKLDSFTEG